jgi:hypothetical protein
MRIMTTEATQTPEGGFKKNFKKYDETKTYNEYEETEVSFDPSCLELESIADIHDIMDEINRLSLKIYTFGSYCDAQTRILQQLEDEFERWKATKYYQDGIDDKQFKSEKSKERHLINKYGEDYWAYINALSLEKHKLSMLQRVVRSLEGFGFKLHDLKDYNLAINRNS